MDRLPPQIVAFGGGGFSMEAGNALLDDYVLGLTGVPNPKVCFLPSASGDADHYIVRFYRAFSAARCEPSHVSLFRRDKGAGLGCDIAEHLLGQDLIYVGGGSVVSLLGVWQAHGLDDVLRECWRRGHRALRPQRRIAVLVQRGRHGISRPAATGPGPRAAAISNCVHYDGEPGRRDGYHRFLSEGMAPGYAAGDGAALHFRGQSLARVVSSRAKASAYWVEDVGGEMSEEALQVRWLGGSRTLSAA